MGNIRRIVFILLPFDVQLPGKTHLAHTTVHWCRFWLSAPGSQLYPDRCTLYAHLHYTVMHEDRSLQLARLLRA